MSKSSEMSRQIDQTYKNLLEKFNPSARQIITAGKAYLKALHGAAAASQVYLESISKLSSQVEQSVTGAASDIGSSLEQVVDVYREIHSQQSNILKAFFVDFVVPLESNLEKDAKVLQAEHKKFLSNEKSCQEALTKAEGNVRKQRKKKLGSKNTIDKEIKNYQVLEEERLNYDFFIDKSFREVTLQERRRYSFVLERLCTMERHHMSLYSKGSSLLQRHLENWTSVSGNGKFSSISESSLHRIETEGIYSNPEESLPEEGLETPTKRRSHSLDGYLSDGERHSEQSFRQTRFPMVQENSSDRPLVKAKSEYNLKNCPSENSEGRHNSRRSSIVMVNERKSLARATFPFQATADNQLTFEEGDVINLIGEKSKGWQYGENQRSHKIGWFPVAYTECLEDEDSAIGCSYNNDPPSLQSKVSYGVTKREESPYVPLRGQSLDRLDYNKYERRVRTDEYSPSNPPKRRERSVPVRSSPTSLHQILIEEEKCRTYYSIPPPPGSSCTSDNRKSYETFNSHLFLSDDMEEDLESYEGSYRETRRSRRYEDNKITKFGADHKINPVNRPRTSPDLQARFMKSVSSRDSSTQGSDDSGFSKEDNKQSTSSYSESCSKSCSKSCNSSWVTDSYDSCSNRNMPDNDCYNSYQSDGKGSPTFLRYLYPSYKESTSSTPIRHASVDALDKTCTPEYKKENWISNAFGTLGKKKKNLVSPCAQKIASQKARKKNEKSSLQRSSSLLCLDMNCTSSPEETYASNYEELTYATWHHKPKIEVLNTPPSPPPYDPPPLPANSPSTYIQQSIAPKSVPWSRNGSSEKTPESSSGNSSWSESDGSCMEAYMVVKENNRDGINLQNTQNERRRILTRSYTWASPDFQKTPKVLVVPKNKKKYKPVPNSCKKTRSKLSKPSFISNPFTSQNPLKKKNSFYRNTLPPIPPHGSNNKEDVAPPLPPRKKPQPPLQKTKKEVNIFNYSEFMCQRLANPDGTCRFDQRSFTTGQKCSAWYDLWDNDASVGKLV